MTLIDRARHLLTCDELRGRVPDEITAFLREVVALEPIGYFDGSDLDDIWPNEAYQEVISKHGTGCPLAVGYPISLYTLETSHAPE